MYARQVYLRIVVARGLVVGMSVLELVQYNQYHKICS